MTPAKSQEEATCQETAQHLDSSTLLIDGTSMFEWSDSSVLNTEPQTTPAKRQEKAMSSETAQPPESSIWNLDL